MLLCVNRKQKCTRVDVSFTIFDDFCQFSVKNWRFFENQCYDIVLAKISSTLSIKRYFLLIFSKTF
jgi:hypothetical protein